MEQYLSIILSGLTLIGLLIGFRDKIFRRGRSEQSVKDRVSNLEKNQLEVCKDIKDIKENHLTHIQASIEKININLAEVNTTLKFIIKEK